MYGKNRFILAYFVVTGMACVVLDSVSTQPLSIFLILKVLLDTCASSAMQRIVKYTAVRILRL